SLGICGRSESDGELHLRVVTSSLPTRFESARCGCGGMEARERVRRRIECDSEILSRQVAQMQSDERVLDRWRLWLRSFPGELFQRGWSGGDSGGLKTFSGGGRKVLRGRQPLIQFRITAEA